MGDAEPVIALVRHGETDWNLAGRIQGRTDIPLNETGRAQAAATAATLERAAGALGPWRVVHASPLGRAIETAEIIAAGLGLASPVIHDGLWERFFGEAEGVEFTEAHARWPGLVVPGAETHAELATRTAATLEHTLTAAPRTIVVAHGAMLRAGISRLTGTEMPRIANGEVWLLHRTAAGVGVAPLAEHPALGAAAGAADALLQRGSEASEAVEQL